MQPKEVIEMADIQMPESTPCKFGLAWQGACGKLSDNGWCSKHEPLVCTSCGEKATQECEVDEGPLVCGAPLCDGCEHVRLGNHVTKEVAEQMKKEKEQEKDAKIASRTSSVQRMHPELNCPLNLLELLKGDRENYELRKGYLLVLEHGLMGTFPAIFSNEKERVVITLEKELITKVWEHLSPRKSQLVEQTYYVLEEAGVVYPDLGPSEYCKETSEPFVYLTEEEFDRLIESEQQPFKWAPGLIGGDMSKEEFVDTIKAAMGS